MPVSFAGIQMLSFGKRSSMCDPTRYSPAWMVTALSGKGLGRPNRGANWARQENGSPGTIVLSRHDAPESQGWPLNV